MEEIHHRQTSETASVVKVAREPAIIINGVPDLPPDFKSESLSEPSNAAEPQVDHRFGEWLEGRKVRKIFGDKYYVGKVVKYDSESNWYNVVYQDGDQEDLEWQEVEEVLLPLDITIPLKTLILDKFGYQNAVPDFRSNVGRSANEQKSNNLLQLVPASTSNDALGGQLVTVTAGVNAQASVSQPRKRGRPRKDASMSTNSQPSQPKRRGRPPKNRNMFGNAQSAECTENSLAIVPVDDAGVSADKQEASRRQNSVLMRNAQTARAEKLAKAERLKRGNSGTQF
uniref:PTM/DIR17-like Tudor domain-containing protein n=1 Tax=Leersia perrieri TaxID=77586 RepID=A0A0D9V7I6_9ORYZ